MAKKYTEVSKLANQASRFVTKDAENWKKFLRTASRLYKYGFADQLLIFAQRPDAAACASLELWNDKMHRWIKKGSKGIALIYEDKTGRPRLRYVFDVKDTRPVYGARMPYLWAMQEKDHEAVMEVLEKRYGKTGAQGLGGCLMDISEKAAGEVYKEHFEELSDFADGKLLEDMERTDMESIFRDTVAASVQYMVLVRCGLNADRHISGKELEGITAFHAPAALDFIGNAVSSISQEILQKIGREIRLAGRKREAQEKEENRNRHREKEKQEKEEKALAKQHGIDYSNSIEEFNTLKHKSKERREKNERADIYEERRLSDTGPGDGRGGRSGRNADREIRNAEAELPERAPQGDIHGAAAVRGVDETLAGDRQGGTGTGGQGSIRNDEAEGDRREAESGRSDGMDTGGKYDYDAGRGSGGAGDRLQVGQENEIAQREPEREEKQENKDKKETAGGGPAVFVPEKEEKAAGEPEFVQLSLFPTAEEQIGHIMQLQAGEKQADMPPAVSDIGKKMQGVPDDITGRVLTSGGTEKNSVLRIIAFYQKSPTKEEAAAFLRKEYGTGGKGLTIGGKEYAVWFDKNGMRIAPERRADVPEAAEISWEEAAEMVLRLLESGTYAPQEKLDAARENECRELAENLWHLRQNLSEEAEKQGFLPHISEAYIGGFPDGTKKISEIIKKKEGRAVLAPELKSFANAYRADRQLLRFHYYDPWTVMEKISRLDIEAKQFHGTEGFQAEHGSFITEDEIDRMLQKGSSVEEGKMRIYAYACQGHGAKELAEFLRDEYGTGGSGSTGIDIWHDPKGIKFTRSDDASGNGGYDTVFLKWNQVQERIKKLIGAGKFLSPEEMAYTPEYEKMQLARSLYAFFYHGEHRAAKGKAWDLKKGESDFRPVLDDEKMRDAIYEDMVGIFAAWPENDRNYKIMKKAIEDMAAYRRGEYSLFKPLPAALRQEERAERQRRKAQAKNGAPADALEAAARVLARKGKRKTKEQADGQLSFDFGVPGAGKQETEERKAKRAGRNLIPNVRRYLELKAGHPDKLIAVKAGEYYLFYGKDAEAAAPVLSGNILWRDVPGLGEVPITGGRTWQAVLEKLSAQGENILVAAPDPEKGEDAPYKIIGEAEGNEKRLAEKRDMEEAEELIETFCYNEYGSDGVDFGNPEHIAVAYTTTEDEAHEIVAEANLLDFSMNLYIDNVPVHKDSYGSLRELIDKELSVLEFDSLVDLGKVPEKILAEFLPEEEHGETGDVEETEPPAVPVEIEGGQIAADNDSAVKINSSEKLPYNIGMRKIKAVPDGRNFRITDDALGTGGQKTKYQRNVEAIRILKKTEAEGSRATPAEQEALSKYTGWGALAQAFDPGNEKWAKEYAELKGLLTPEEYESARETVLNAHYTSPVIIKAVYEALEKMDFEPGNILEPSCGIGNFFGLVPEKMESAGFYGVELDGLTGRIAKQLYQRADITIGGFEAADYLDNFFDLALGNVPFGDYKVHDRRYDRQNLLIHDYFLVKALDKVRPGGIMAFITTKGTMDKADEKAREALAEKADLLGAVRLPNNAFQANAGTSVTSDILFFQKRGSAPEKMPEWVHIGQTEEGMPLNSYFLKHPEMVLGKMGFWANMYGKRTETSCLPIEGADLGKQLAEALKHIAEPDRELLNMDAPGQEEEQAESMAADPDVRNFSYTEKNGKLYFRENSRMRRVEPGALPAARIRGMIAIRDCARSLIGLQMQGAGDEEVKAEQSRLNRLYDSFQKQYGRLTDTGNRRAFRQDSSYPLLCSLEVLDEEGKFERKADMFTKRTIMHRQPVAKADTAVEALGASIGERACVDLGYMASLMGGSDKISKIVEDLKGIIFKSPETGPFDIEGENSAWHAGWQTADEYLSGNVRMKLETARKAAEKFPEFAVNVKALEKVQPKDLSAPEIGVRIGAPWVDTKYYREFLFELLKTPEALRGRKIDVMYADATGEWRVKGKLEDRMTNARAWNTYGTKRANAYEIFEDTLNQRNVQVFDTKTDAEGKQIRVLNEKETAVAGQKQEAMKEAFQNWIFKEPERRSDLCAVYNRLFNSVRPREYNGEHINFIGMNPEIKLEPHQRNAVARILYGGNTLLAHVVGAGKTYEMAAAAMESKRLGLCKKSIIVVPNHLTEQWGGDFLTLYPGANVLVATKKDFEPRNRKQLCARIATGDYDAVIIGHTQFEKIPISAERQEAIIKEQIDEIENAIIEAKAEKGEQFTIKQMVKSLKRLKDKMDRLYDKKKDDVVTFEELGIDRLFVDEAHGFKNLYTHTKMRNVAGIGQTEAQKSSDMFTKCRYMDEITGGRGVVFATGTPVSNSMVELYTMMRYLQYNMLEEGYRDSTGKVRSLTHFDNWAATFGEQVTAVELKPEGTGFRLRTRFARFYNLPELMNRWKEAADIQTADMLDLPVPEAEYITIQTEPSGAQKEMVKWLAERAEKIRKEKTDPRIDNMLKITSDGRKLALDQRIMNPLLPDDPGSKVNACVENVFQIWRESTPDKGTQLIFSDLSTPRGKADSGRGADENSREAGNAKKEEAAEMSVYEDIRQKLIKKGVPKQEIVFIHEAKTEAQKAELFAKVRSGKVRILLGSTQKMGAGTNVQTKLIASHDLDCPWRPSDLEQRAGRIVRRGNENAKVKIFRYVTKGTFDAYTWGIVEAKQKFIGQIMTSKNPARSIEDVDATALSYAEVKMLATGDPRIKEKMDLDIQVAKLKILKASHQSGQYEMQDKVRGYFPNKIKETELYIGCVKADMAVLAEQPMRAENFSITVMGTVYTDRKSAGEAVIAACRLMDNPEKEIQIGKYRGFPMMLCLQNGKFLVTMKRHLTYTAELSMDAAGNAVRIQNALEKMPKILKQHEENLMRLQKELESAREEAERPFAQEEELAEKSARLAELNAVLDNEEKGSGQQAEEQEEKTQGNGENVRKENMPEAKASVIKMLKDFKPPALIKEKTERSAQEREAV